jgi:epoxyqueuosine reductase
LEDKLSGWIYGCDICQEVCPWNITFSQLSNENSFKPRENLQERPIPQWEKLTEEDFRILFKKSAVKRTKYSGLKRNISLLEKNSSKNPN